MSIGAATQAAAAAAAAAQAADADRRARRNLPAYPHSKPSSLEWLGDVPHHWAVKRLKYSASINDESLPETTSPDFEFQYVDIGGVNAVDGIKETEQVVFEDAPSRARRKVRHGDTIVSTVRTYLRAIAPIKNPPENLIVSTGFAVVRPRKVEPTFLAYALRESSFVESVVARSVGVSYPACSASEVGGIAIPLPDPPEQRAIAAFLDRETGRVDRLVAKKKELIERLKEKRTALISHTVTHGVPPAAARAAGLPENPPLKPSGLAWLGDIPKHWEVSKMSRVCASIRDGTHNPPDRAAGIHRLLSVRNVREGKLALLSDDRTMTPEDFAELQRSYTVEEGDIVLAIVGATTGKSAIVGKLENVTVQRSLAILRPNKSAISSSFLHYVIQSPVVQTEIALTVFKYSAQPGIYLEDIGRLPVVRPPPPRTSRHRGLSGRGDREARRFSREGGGGSRAPARIPHRPHHRRRHRQD